eukprot:gene32729-40396_t
MLNPGHSLPSRSAEDTKRMLDIIKSLVTLRPNTSEFQHVEDILNPEGGDISSDSDSEKEQYSSDLVLHGSKNKRKQTDNMSVEESGGSSAGSLENDIGQISDKRAKRGEFQHVEDILNPEGGDISSD